MKALPMLSCADTVAGVPEDPPSRLLHWVVATRSRRVVAILLAVWVINGFDLALTLFAQHDGMLHEQNPVARMMLSYGAGAVMVFKIALVAGATGVLVWLRRHRCAELAALLVVLAYSLVAVQWKLCYEVYDMTHANRQAAVADELASSEAWASLLPAF